MEIKGKVHCFFEQSGTFKNEFIKLGIPAEDYDIQNNFGQTDHVVDLFAQIEAAYEGMPSIFDKIGKDDLIMAFFPCIKFCSIAEFNQKNNQFLMRKAGVDIHKIYDYLKKESDERYKFYQVALKMYGAVEFNGLRMVMENPWHEMNYTNNFWFYPVTIIDKDRTRRGDYFKKPTGYWFVGCEPTDGYTIQQTPKNKMLRTGIRDTKKDREMAELMVKKGLLAGTAKRAPKTGICSEERSLISPDYARNFICDFILGKSQPNVCKTLFD